MSVFDVLKLWLVFLTNGESIAGSALTWSMVAACSLGTAAAASSWRYLRTRRILSATATGAVSAGAVGFLLGIGVIATGGSSEGPGLLVLPIVNLIVYGISGVAVGLAATAVVAVVARVKTRPT